jgi:hypothetical protein
MSKTPEKIISRQLRFLEISMICGLQVYRSQNSLIDKIETTTKATKNKLNYYYITYVTCCKKLLNCNGQNICLLVLPQNFSYYMTFGWHYSIQI